MPVGYSGTPLPRKLGIKESTKVAVLHGPPDYETLLGSLPSGARVTSEIRGEPDLVHVFVTAPAELAAHLKQLRSQLPDSVAVWVSWPKKASKVRTDVTEDVIRSLALPLGFVDVKVCAVSEVWSGLKLVVRKELRARGAA